MLDHFIMGLRGGLPKALLWSVRGSLIGVLAFFCGSLSAHEMRPAYLQIDELEIGEYQVSWKVPAKGDERLSLTPMLDGVPIFEAHSSRFLNGAYIENGEFNRPNGLAGSTLFIQGLSATFTDVLIRFKYLDGSILNTRLSPELPIYNFPLTPTGSGVFKTYLSLGIKHILLGIDHLLFVIGILFITGFNRRLFWAITGFSIAHSITLGLAAFSVVRLPVPPIEAAIALSIVFMASEILRNQRHTSGQATTLAPTLSHRRPILISSLFGLLHGFGFASVLAQTGLPKNEGLWALLYFNLGVEFGQLLFILTVFVTVVGIRSVGSRLGFLVSPVSQKAIVYVIGSVASFWVIERTLLF